LIVSGFHSIIDQEKPIRILTTLLKNGTLPHAFLFTGTDGVGKQATAVALAMACNCQRENTGTTAANPSDTNLESPSVKSDMTSIDPCGVCKSCKKIASGKHADIIRIQPSGSFIKIAQIRELVHTLAMKPYEAKMRVVIVNDAEALNAAASNALLKILEEPPQWTILVLIATRKSGLLPTIVSRCQEVAFNPISKKNIVHLLRQEHGLTDEAAGIIAAMANGSYFRAQSMARGNWLKRRKWLLDEIEALSLQNAGRLLALAEKLSREKQAISDSLEIIKVWFRDLMISRYDPGKIVNQDLASKIKIAAAKTALPALLSKVNAVQQVQNRLAANTNLRLTLEGLLLQLAQPSDIDN
jgi:DNA polymerase-3 subunit delta'